MKGWPLCLMPRSELCRILKAMEKELPVLESRESCEYPDGSHRTVSSAIEGAMAPTLAPYCGPIQQPLTMWKISSDFKSCFFHVHAIVE